MKIISDSIDVPVHINPILKSYFSDLTVGVLDLETTGLNPLYSGIVLGGLLELKEQAVYHQFFAEKKAEEKNLLEAYVDLLSSFDILVSYNGDTFDLPFLQERLKKYNIDYDLNKHWSFDLYKIINKYSDFRQILPNLKQKTIEEFLGIDHHRKDEISGGESVELYKRYLKEPREETAEIILLHNKDDLMQLALIMKIMDKLDIHKIMFHTGFAVSLGSSRFFNNEIKIKKGQVEVKALGFNIPSDFYSFKESHHAIYKDNRLFLTIPLETVKSVDIFDLLLFSEDTSSFEKFPAFENDYLIVREQGKIYYNEINKLIRLIELEILKESKF